MRPDLSVLRSHFDTWLTEQGQIFTPGELVWDDETGTYVPGPDVVVWSGPCLVRPLGDVATKADAGETTWTLTRYAVTMPADAPAAVDATFKLTACPFDAALVGQTITLIDVPLDAWQVCRECVGVTVD